eukprot:g7116.t1
MRRHGLSPPLAFVFATVALVGPTTGFRISSSSCALPRVRSARSLGPWRPGAWQWGAQRGGGGGSSRRRGRGGSLRGGLCMARDLYEVLEIPETADQSEIKRAYRRKALRTHPDVNTSPTAKAEFSEVVNAYEVLSDEKKRANYNRKRKFTNPFNRGRTAGAAGGGGGGGGGGGASWGSSTYNAAKEEAARRWREQNPTPDEIDDSFGDIFRDFVGGIASAGGGGGILNDVVDFLENRVDGFSSDTSVEFEDLMASRNLQEMKEELENTRLLLEQLRIKSRKLSVDKMTSENEVAAMKAGGSKRFTDIDELDRQMAAVERAAGIKARYDELQGHVKRANARLGRLERKLADLEGGAAGGRSAGGSSSGSSYTTGGGGGGGSGSGTSRSQYTSSSSSAYSSSRGPSSGTSSSGRRSGSGGGGGGSGSGSGKTPPPRRRAPGGRRRADDPEVEAELDRLKREMGMK